MEQGRYGILTQLSGSPGVDRYLAVERATEAGPGGYPGPDDRELVHGDLGAQRVLRVYRADAAEERIAFEAGVLQADGGETLPCVLGFGTTRERPVIILEAVGLCTLRDLVRRNRLDCGQVVTVLAPLAAAVTRWRQGGIVHERLSPTTVRIDADGRPRVVGLGGLISVTEGRRGSARAVRRAHRGLRLLVRVVTGALPRTHWRVRWRLRAMGWWAGVRRDTAGFSERLERTLFALAMPRPLECAQLQPEVPKASGDAGGVRPGLHDPSGVPGRDLVSSVGPLVASPGRARGWVRRYRRPLLVGGLGGAAVLVLALTLVPPGVPSGRASPSIPSSRPVPTLDPTGRLRPSESSASATGATSTPRTPLPPNALVTVAADLLRRRGTCLRGPNIACLDTVVEPGSALEHGDHAAIRAGKPPAEDLAVGQVTVLDDLGGAVLVAVALPTRPQPATALLVETGAGWRLRAVFG